MKKVIITGPTGSIGIALINKLIGKRVSVVAIARPGSPRIKNLPASSLVTVIECDLSALEQVKNMLFGAFDVFYHFGWDGTFGQTRNDLYLQTNNIKYALDAVLLAQHFGCHTFIGAGSQAEYGRVEGILSPTTPAYPENGYGIAKLCANSMSRALCREKNIKHIWARIVSVYGPYDGVDTMIISTINKLLNNEKPPLTKCEQQWDYLYSKDAANAMFLLGNKGVDGETYCLASGKTKPLSFYVETLKNIVNPNASLGFGEVPYAARQVMNLCADISNLKKDTGFAPCYTFEEGIAETIDWCKKSNTNIR